MCCPFHDLSDKSQHCSLTFTKRWAFVISRYALSVHGNGYVPGRHCPLSEKFLDMQPSPVRVPFSAKIGDIRIIPPSSSCYRQVAARKLGNSIFLNTVIYVMYYKC
jgi:hypothetical protein